MKRTECETCGRGLKTCEAAIDADGLIACATCNPTLHATSITTCSSDHKADAYRKATRSARFARIKGRLTLVTVDLVK